MEHENNFSKIAAVIDKMYEDIVHEVCHVPRVTNLKDFYRIYELEEKSVDEKYAEKPKVAPTAEIFAAAFKQFDEFPANLQKAKKAPGTRERLNSTISKSSPSLNDSAIAAGNSKETSISLNVNKFSDVPSGSETLSSFIKFQKQLKQLNMEIMQQNIDKEYASKLKQLNTFAQQLERLLLTDKVGKSALTPEEENILESMANRIDDLNFIRGHKDVFRKQNGIVNINAKLENLVEILSYCLSAVNSFNIN